MRNLITLIDAICEVYDNVHFSPQPDGTTFCNQAVDYVAKAMGYLMFDSLDADQIVGLISSSGDWSTVAFEKAQDLANQGSLVIAGLDSKSLNQSHGHVCIIRPGKPCYSGKWPQAPCPRVLNIGAENFLARAKRGPLMGMSCGLNESFRDMPKIYVLRSTL